MRVRIRGLPSGTHRQRQEESAGSLGLDEQEYRFTRPIGVLFTLERLGEKILLRAVVSTSLEMVCSRCVEPVEVAIREKMTLVLISDQGPVPEDDEDLKLIPAGTEEVDVSEEVRQTILLAIPTKPLCRGDCQGLCPRCGTNLNTSQCHCPAKVVDSRWSGLKKLLSNETKGE